MMNDINNTNENFIRELEKLRNRVVELEALDAKRRQMNEELKKSENKLNNILSSLADLLFLFDTEGRFVFYHSPSGELEVNPDKFIGKKHSEVMPPYIQCIGKS